MRPNLLLSLGQLLVFGSPGVHTLSPDSGVQTLSQTIPVVELNPDFGELAKKNNNGCLKILHVC